MKSKSKFFIIIILCGLIIFSFFLFKEKAPYISSGNISYADDDIPLPSATSIPEENNISKNITIEEEYGLIDIATLPTVFSIELRYASTNNFAGKQFYPKIAKAYLQKSTAEKLMAANEEFYKLGYRIKIFDAYRPRKYQYELREAAAEINPATQGYIANPETGSHHNRGTTVDITLTDLNGHELDMPTAYDHFGPEAGIKYNGCTEEQKKNRELLGTIMEKHGFRRISSEWWHFDDLDFRDYPLLDVDFVDLYE